MRHLLTMTRGSDTTGLYDIDEVMALPTGWVSRLAAAPPMEPPGTRFRYDDGAAHLFGAALATLGRLWMENGAGPGRQIVDPSFAAQMCSAHSEGGPPEHRRYGYFLWIDEHGPFAGGWAGQHVTLVPAARAVVVTTGDPGFDPGPPPTDRLPANWRPARDLVTERLIPALLR